MNTDIQIIEKPDWASWEEIHQVLWKAHEQNRQKGMYMALPSKSAEEIQNYIEGKGKMFVALSLSMGSCTLLLALQSYKFSATYGNPCALFCDLISTNFQHAKLE